QELCGGLPLTVVRVGVVGDHDPRGAYSERCAPQFRAVGRPERHSRWGRWSGCVANGDDGKPVERSGGAPTPTPPPGNAALGDGCEVGAVEAEAGMVIDPPHRPTRLRGGAVRRVGG